MTNTDMFTVSTVVVTITQTQTLYTLSPNVSVQSALCSTLHIFNVLFLINTFYQRQRKKGSISLLSLHLFVFIVLKMSSHDGSYSIMPLFVL